MPTTNRRLVWAHFVFGGLALVGLVDAAILTIEHYTRKGLPCTFTGGCERVLTSRFSEVAGQPIALLGVVFYGVVLYMVVHSIINREPLPKKILLAWSSVGFVSSLGLTFIQAFIIKAWCQYCLFSALTSTLIFIFAIIYWRKNHIKKEQSNDEA